MNNANLNILLYLSLLLLQACASTENKISGPVPVEDRAAKPGQAELLKESIDYKQKNDLPEQKLINKLENTRPIVLALLEESKAKMAQGKPTIAAASLERALRLDPKNARLWMQLGLVRLRQKNWQQAISLAKKSNSLAVKDVELQAANWKIIAQAHSRAGNKGVAKIAAERAFKLEKKL
jgi:tetratricopeptide (TPR) repeat protein